ARQTQTRATLLRYSSRRCTSAATNPSISTTLRDDFKPATSRMLSLDTPSASASTASTAPFALPRSGGAVTHTLSVSPIQPATQLRDDLGTTLICSLTG